MTASLHSDNDASNHSVTNTQGGVVYGPAEEALWAEEGGSKSPAGRVHVTFPDGLERTYWFQSFAAAERFVANRLAG
jgi:hypothetical protein